MFSARIAIRLPSSFMPPSSSDSATSGFARRLGEDRSHQRPQRAAATLRAHGAPLVVLADRHRASDFLLASLTEVFVYRHGHPPSGQDGVEEFGDVGESTPAGA